MKFAIGRLGTPGVSHHLWPSGITISVIKRFNMDRIPAVACMTWEFPCMFAEYIQVLCVSCFTCHCFTASHPVQDLTSFATVSRRHSLSGIHCLLYIKEAESCRVHSAPVQWINCPINLCLVGQCVSCLNAATCSSNCLNLGPDRLMAVFSGDDLPVFAQTWFCFGL